MRHIHYKILHCFKKLGDIANYIAAFLLLIVFLSFVINVALRYTLGISFGWIVEFSLILWVWIIFLGAGIFLRNSDHVSLSYMYVAFHIKVYLILKLISYAIIFIGGILMIAPVWDYMDFLKIRRSDVLGIPMNKVFFIYKIFLVSLLVKYGYLTIRYLYKVIFIHKKHKMDIHK